MPLLDIGSRGHDEVGGGNDQGLVKATQEDENGRATLVRAFSFAVLTCGYGSWIPGLRGNDDRGRGMLACSNAEGAWSIPKGDKEG